MVTLPELWLPILLSAVGVFFTSSLIHMVLKYHRSDYTPIPNEDEVMEAMRRENIRPGYYYLPYAVDPNDLAKPEVKAKFEKGPVAFVTVLPSGAPSMAKPLVSWLIYCVVVALIVAYLTGRTAGASADYLHVFRIAGTSAFLAHSGSAATESIWKGMPWSVTAKHMFDGLLYALVTAGIFGALWPH